MRRRQVFLHSSREGIWMATEKAAAMGDPALAENPELVGRIQARDPETLQAVVRAYLGQVVRAARGAGMDPQRAEDVAQATFVAFLEAASRFEGRSRIRTFLFGILYKKIAEARRELGRDRKTEPIDEIVEARFHPDGTWSRPPRPLDDQIYDAEARDKVEECLEEAPANQRMAFVLREAQGFSTEEICKILEVTRTNLGVILYRARHRLRECLESKGVRG